MNVAFVITKEYFYVGFIAITSFLKHNNNVNLYIVYDETLPANRQEELNFFENNKNVKTINFIQIDSTRYKNFSLTHKTSYIFELAELVNVDKMLLIHNIDLVVDNLKELYDTDISGYPYGAVEYVLPSRILKDRKEAAFSTITFLFNFKYLREHKYFEKLISKEFLAQNSQYTQITDFVIINNLTENIKRISIKYI